jgi:amino acid transporter
MGSIDKRKIGTFDSVNILVGGMIGSAIFSLSGVTILQAGPATILSWVIGAVILLGYGLETAELASMFPNSGGIMFFPALTLGKNREQGRLWGWISSWAYLFGCISGAAFSAIYVGTYLGVAFPLFANIQVQLAIATVIICGVLNVVNFAVTGKINTILTVLLIFTLVAFCFIAFTTGSWDAANFKPFFTQGTGGKTGFISSVPIAMIAYGTIVAVAFMVGEIKDPNKTVPKAMTIAMAIVVVLYLLVIVATLGLISSNYLQENPGMAYIPLYAAAFAKLSNIVWLPALVSISAVLALFTTTIVTMALSARAIQACALQGILPKKLGENHRKTGVPVNATVLIILITGTISAFPSLVNIIINLGALCNVIVVAIICVTVIKARSTHEYKEGQFKAPGGKFLPVVILILLISFYIPSILSGGSSLWIYTVLYYVIGMIIYYVGTSKLSKKPSLAV